MYTCIYVYVYTYIHVLSHPGLWRWGGGSTLPTHHNIARLLSAPQQLFLAPKAPKENFDQTIGTPKTAESRGGVNHHQRVLVIPYSPWELGELPPPTAHRTTICKENK